MEIDGFFSSGPQDDNAGGYQILASIIAAVDME